MLWITLIYIASALFCIVTLRDVIKEGLEDGDIDDIHADLIHSFGNVLSFIPLINTLLSLTMLYIYAVHLIPWVKEQVAYCIWRVKWRIRRFRNNQW